MLGLDNVARLVLIATFTCTAALAQGQVSLLGTRCDVPPAPRVAPEAYDNAAISGALALEARARTVPEAMAIKTAALVHVKTAADFEALTRAPVSVTTLEYRAAISDFIAAHIERVPMRPGDLDRLGIIESRATTVKVAMAVKQAGVPAVCSVADVATLARMQLPYPTPAYSEAVGAFAIATAAAFLDRNR